MTIGLSCTPLSSPHGERKEPYVAMPKYRDYVAALCQRNPSLLTLKNFLCNPKARYHGCRMAALDFRKGLSKPSMRQIMDIDYLPNELLGKAETHLTCELDYQHPLQGRILVMEDLTVDIVELLGTELDIDPLFFAMHLHTVHRTGMHHQMPDEATLPSRLRSNDYINISYHRPVTCDNAHLAGGKWIRDASVDRKVVLLRSTTIALASHCASVIKVQRSNGFWIAIILVDPPLGETHFQSGYKDDVAHRVRLNLRPFLGTYEDFREPPKFSEDWSDLTAQPPAGPLEDVLQYWERNVPAQFDARNPTLRSLAYYPLRIVAAEWVKYVEVMQHCIKLYEYKGNELPDLDKFNKDLRELQGWRLRTLNSQQKVGSVIRKLKSLSFGEGDTMTDPLLEDYEVINSNIQGAGARLENMLPVVTSLVQILDARQSFAETANISRLTILALIFVPLTFVSSLFSMNTDTLPGSSKFWIYFVVAIPVTALVFLVAKPPVAIMNRTSAWLQKHKRRRRVSDRPRNGKDAMHMIPEA
jgi:hypothetical protein